MRKSILLLLLASACTAADAADHTVVNGFLEQAIAVGCEPVDLGTIAVEELRTATDSSFLVLDAAQRRVTEFADDLRPRWSLEYDEVGPAAVDRPISATLLGDTAVAIAARGGLKLVVLDRAGALIRARSLPFMPGPVTATANGNLLVAAVPLGATPASLLFRLHDDELEALPVPRRPFADMTVGALGNSTRVEPLDTTVLVVHQFLAPRAFRVAPATGSVAAVALPTPDATADRIGYVPSPPVSEAQLGEMLTPAIAVGVDRLRGEVYLLTRSGRQVDGRWERALLRLDRDLGFLAGYTLDAHAVHLAVLPRRQAALVVDDMDRSYLCPLDA